MEGKIGKYSVRPDETFRGYWEVVKDGKPFLTGIGELETALKWAMEYNKLAFGEMEVGNEI